ncbi:MAG: DEAD/DEAH box helicase [Mariprofundales bacterium]
MYDSSYNSSNTSQSSPKQILQNVFGYDSFRFEQELIIDNVIAGTDVLAVMPTGGGKSLCYQIPSLLRQGVGIVVSPLIALMHDQVGALKQQGIAAASLNSAMSYREQQKVEYDVQQGRYAVLYIAPERLLMPRILDMLAKCNIALFFT